MAATIRFRRNPIRTARARYRLAIARVLVGAILTAFLLDVNLAGQANSNSAALVESGHWKRARPLIEHEYQANPNDAESAWLFSKVNLAFGNLEQALSLAEKAVAIDEKNSIYHYQLAEVCGRTAEKASLFSKGHWAKRFKAEAETAAGLDPNNLEARFGLLEYYLQAPRLMGGGKEKAGAMADEIGRIDSVSGNLAQVRIAQDQKDWTKEHAFFVRAAEGGARTYDDLISIANYFLRVAATGETSPGGNKESRAGDLSMAEKLAHEAARREPGRVRAYEVFAGLYSAQKRWKDLDSMLAESEKQVPDNLAPYYRAAHVLLNQSSRGSKDMARGENYLRKYLSQNPEPDSPSPAEAHWQLGLVLEKEGRKKEAVSEVEAALSINPDFAQAKIDLKRIQNGS